MTEPATSHDAVRGRRVDAARACDDCLRRAWLLARTSGHLDTGRARIMETLALADVDLIDALGGSWRAALRSEYAAFDVAAERARCAAAGVSAICGCDPGWPAGLRDLPGPPSVLFGRGDTARLGDDGVAIAVVGARRASEYGVEVARAIGRGLAVSGITVISGMAGGIDAAAHAGALEGGGVTFAIVPGGAERPYPASARSLHRRIVAAGAAVSELPPGTAVRRWMFLARNRMIAALATMTVVVEAGDRSGSLVTAAVARELGRAIGAVPGRVTAPQAAGPNALLADGAVVVRSAVDVIETVTGVVAGAHLAVRAPPAGELQPLLDAIADGADTHAALDHAGFGLHEVLAGVAALELSGHVRRSAGGRLTVVA